MAGRSQGEQESVKVTQLRIELINQLQVAFLHAYNLSILLHSPPPQKKKCCVNSVNASYKYAESETRPEI